MTHDQLWIIHRYGLCYNRPWANISKETMDRCIAENSVGPIEESHGTDDLTLTGRGVILMIHKTEYGQIDIRVDDTCLVDVDVCFTNLGYIYTRIGRGHGITIETKWAKDKVLPKHYRDMETAVNVAILMIFGPSA